MVDILIFFSMQVSFTILLDGFNSSTSSNPFLSTNIDFKVNFIHVQLFSRNFALSVSLKEANIYANFWENVANFFSSGNSALFLLPFRNFVFAKKFAKYVRKFSHFFPDGPCPLILTIFRQL